MNWDKGFRRIAFFVSLLFAITVAVLSIVIVILIHTSAKDDLSWKKQTYEEKYQVVKNIPDGFILDNVDELKKAGFTEEEIKDYVATNANKEPNRIPSFEELISENESTQKQPETVDTNKMWMPKTWVSEETKLKNEILELEKSFWLNLSTSGLVGLCLVSGLAVGATGFSVVWIIYIILRWLVLGFTDK